VNVLATTEPLGVAGGGPLTVNLGNQGSVQGILGVVLVANPSSTTKVTVDDHADKVGRNVTVTNEGLFGATTGSLLEFIVGPTPGGIGISDAGTQQVTINTGTGSNFVNVQSTGAPTSLVDYGQTGVIVGGNGISVQGIAAALTISNAAAGKSGIIIDDNADKVVRNAILNKSSTLTGFGSLTGLAPAAINYEYAGTAALQIDTNLNSSVDVLSDGGLFNTFVNGHRE